MSSVSRALLAPRALAVPRGPVRAARLVARGVIVGMGIGYLYWAFSVWQLTDAAAYWEAALRLRSGAELYLPITDIEASNVYRYSPWFAWAAVPFTLLPVQLAGAIWSLILIAASCLAVVPLARRGAWLQVAFFWPILIGISAIGNVQPLLVAALVHGLERRSGPLWIALAASLKAVPLAFALVYLGRGEWRRFAGAIGLTALLVAPALIFYGDQLDNYVTDPGGATMLAAWPAVFVAAAAAGILATVRLARGRYGWLAAGVTATLAVPRFFVYDVTFLLPGLPATRQPPSGAPDHSGNADSSP